MSKVSVNAKILKWALDRSNQTVDNLSKTFPKIQGWLTGEVLPTLKQLEALSKKTSTPLGYFFLTNPPIDRIPIPYFRTMGDDLVHRPSPELIDTIHVMQRRQSWMKEYLDEEGMEPLKFVGSSKKNEQPKAIAQKIREVLNMEEEWASSYKTWTEALKALREKMEDIGIMVIVNGIVENNTHRKLDPSEFRGFVIVDKYIPLVFVNGADYKAAQMFTLGHELAHVFLGSSAAFDLRQMMPANDPIEILCNKVSAEFLIPEDRLKDSWTIFKKSNDPFQTIARKFKVSVLVAARRTLDSNLISKKEYFEFYNNYKKTINLPKVKDSSGGDFYATQNLRIGRPLRNAVIQAISENRLLYSDAYKLTGLYGKTFENYLSNFVS